MTAAGWSILAALCVGAAVMMWPTKWLTPTRGNGPAQWGDQRRDQPGDGLEGPEWAEQAGAPKQRMRDLVSGVVATIRSRLPGANQARQRREVGEVHFLDSLAAAMEAGLPVPQAVELAISQVSVGEEHAGAWRAVRETARTGQALAPAWRRLARTTGSSTVESVARAWSVAESSGAPLAGAVRASAHAARERHRLQRAVDAATAGARATAVVLSLLPVAGVGLAALLGINPLRLYGSVPALGSLAGGLLLLLLGHAVVARMVAGVLRGAA